MAIKARDIMTGGAECVGENETLEQAARKMKELDVGALPICKPVTIGADDSIEEAIRTMQEHQVRRLPVIDGHDLVGMLSQADIARNYPEERVGELVEFISY
jgi:CBS domain-containing protein